MDMELGKEGPGECSQSTGLSSLAATPSHKKRVVIDDEPQTDEAVLVQNDEEEKPKRPILDQPVIVLQGREVLFAIGIFFLFAVVVSLIVIYVTALVKLRDEIATTKKQNENITEQIQKITNLEKTMKDKEAKYIQEKAAMTDHYQKMLCESPDCLRAAVDLLDKMNLKVSPCNDFWSYSCGGWLNKSEIPDSRETWGIHSEVEKAFHQKILDDVKWHVVRTGNESAEWKYKTLYGICTKRNHHDNHYNPIPDIIGAWNLSNCIAEEECRFDMQDILEHLLFTYAVDSFFTLKVIKDNGTNVIKIDHGGLSLGHSHYHNNNHSHPPMEMYRDYINRTIALVLGNSTPSPEEHFANNVILVERDIAQFQAEDKRRRGFPESSLTHLSVAELQELVSNESQHKSKIKIDWLRLFQCLSKNVTNTTNVIVVSKSYVTGISHLFSRLKHSDILHYFTWRLVYQLAPFLKESLKSSQQAFIRGKSKPQNSLSRQRFCQEIVMESFPYALTSSIASGDPKISDKIKNVNEMAVLIKNALEKNVTNADWLDEKTKKKFKYRLQNITIKVGYPEFVVNETELDQFYSPFVINDSVSFFDNAVNGLAFKIERMRLRIESNGGDDNNYDQEWASTPLQPKVFYSADDNSLGVTFSLLQKPFYDEARYRYLNYGSLGSMISRELISAMFNIDTRDLLPEWWNDKSYTNFYRWSKKCLEEYYRHLPEQSQQVDRQVIGKLTFGEYIADLGGLGHSYQAYKEWERKNGTEAKLPGLNLTNDQAFFVAFVQNSCKLRRGDKRKRSAPNSAQPVEEMRVRATLFMFDKFQGSFECQNGQMDNTTLAQYCDRFT